MREREWSLKRCASITFIVPVNMSVGNAERKNTRASPLLHYYRRRTQSHLYRRLSPSLLLSLLLPFSSSVSVSLSTLSPSFLRLAESPLIVTRKRRRVRRSCAINPPFSPRPAIISNSFHASPRRCFTTFPRASY